MSNKVAAEDRLVIHASLEVDADEVGAHLIALTKIGFTDVRFEVVTDVTTFKKRVVHDTTAEEFLRGWIEDNATFYAIDAVNYFEANGRTKGSAYTALKLLFDGGELERPSPGYYTRSDVKQIEHKPAKSKAPAEKPSTKPKGGITNRERILQFAQAHPQFEIATIKQHFESQRISPSSASSMVSQMVKAKQIKRIGEHSYALVVKPDKKKAVNGAAEITEAVQGEQDA